MCAGADVGAGICMRRDGVTYNAQARNTVEREEDKVQPATRQPFWRHCSAVLGQRDASSGWARTLLHPHALRRCDVDSNIADTSVREIRTEH